MLKKWNDLPEYMRAPEVKPYYDVLKKKGVSSFFVNDLSMSLPGVHSSGDAFCRSDDDPRYHDQV